MEDNKTKEEILPAVTKFLIGKPTYSRKNHGINAYLKPRVYYYKSEDVEKWLHEYSQQSTKHLQDELDSWKEEHFEMVEDAANTIKELQDRVKELEDNINTRNEREWVLNSRIAELEGVLNYLSDLRTASANLQLRNNHLESRVKELEKALQESIDELKVFKGDIRTQEVINNGITVLNSKS